MAPEHDPEITGLNPAKPTAPNTELKLNTIKTKQKELIDTEFREREGQVVCGSDATANDLMRELFRLGYEVTEIPIKPKDIVNFGMTAVRLDVSDVPVRVVEEVIKGFPQ